jgi:hypothetical protein
MCYNFVLLDDDNDPEPTRPPTTSASASDMTDDESSPFLSSLMKNRMVITMVKTLHNILVFDASVNGKEATINRALDYSMYPG